MRDLRISYAFESTHHTLMKRPVALGRIGVASNRTERIPTKRLQDPKTVPVARGRRKKHKERRQFLFFYDLLLYLYCRSLMDWYRS